jgi:CheY-like chemotaxis protein
LATAKSANLAKINFLANMSHEMRTPLNAIINLNSQLLDTDLNSQQNKMALIAYQESKNLSTLINSILDFSKIEAGIMEVRGNIFDLLNLFDELEMLFCAQFDKSGLDFSVVIAANVPNWVKGDETLLRQALVILISNGLKFTNSGGVTVNVLAEDGQLIEFKVNDTGIGISADSAEHIFNMFYQQDSSRTPKHGGTGLGLSIFRGLVKLMDGDIGYEPLPNGGSSFWLTIPLEETTQPEKNVATRVVHEPVFAKVLLVEDNESGQMVTENILSKAGCSVQLACNGLEAVEAVRQQRFDIVLMDLSMPVMDGLEATRLIRSLKGEASLTPIIAITANAFAEDRDNCLKSGMNGFLSKPVSANKMLDLVAHWSDYRDSIITGVPKMGSDDFKLERSEVADSALPCDEKLDSQLMDIGVLVSMEHEVSREVVEEVVEIFIHETRKHLSALCKAGETADTDALVAEAHAIKSSAGTFGALQLQEVARIVEVLALQGNQDEAIAAIATVEDVAEKTLQLYSSKFPGLPVNQSSDKVSP